MTRERSAMLLAGMAGVFAVFLMPELSIPFAVWALGMAVWLTR